MKRNLEQTIRDDVEKLHRFFAAWFTGSVAADEAVFKRDFLDRFHPDFFFIPSTGMGMALPELAAAVAGAHGANPDLSIAIHDTRIRQVSADTILATYQEWQRSDDEVVGVITSTLMENSPARRWLHVHETALAGDGPQHPGHGPER